MTQRTATIALIAAAALVLVAVGFTAGFSLATPIRTSFSRWQSSRRIRAEKAAHVRQFLDQAAPAVSSRTLEGKPWDLSRERGRTVLLLFWASDCPSSRHLLPQVRSLCGSYSARPDFRPVAVSVDRDEAVLRAYLSAQSIPWTFVFEPGAGWTNSVAKRFAIHRVPSLWLVDRECVIRGLDMSLGQTRDALRSLLEGQGALPPGSELEAEPDGAGCSQ